MTSCSSAQNGHEKFIMSWLEAAQKREYTNLFFSWWSAVRQFSYHLTKDSLQAYTIKETLFVPSYDKIIIDNIFQ